MRVLILKFSFVLLLGHLINWWVIKYSPFNLPEYIPHTPIVIAGVLLMCILIPVLIIFQKRLLKQNPETTIFQLTIQSALVCLIAEFIFQIIRQTALSAELFTDRIYTIIAVTIRVTILELIICFIISFQIKTKKTGQLILIIVGISVLARFLLPLFGYKTD